MRKLAFFRKALIVTAVLAVGLAGFGIGYISAPEEKLPATGSEMQATPALREDEITPAPADEAGIPEPTQSSVPAAVENAQPEKDMYMLKKDGDGLVVLKDEEVVAAFSAELDQIPDQIVKQLETGIYFESLDDIESYLEDYES